ncbi:MAG: hypothetical protein NVSMB63_04440 [Sediminibacterium sp.]
MSVENYITASCAISNHTVYKSGQPVFMNRGVDLDVFLLSVYQYLDLKYARFYKMDNLSKLGWLASEILLKDGFRAENYRPEEMGLLLANASSSLDTDLKYIATVKDIASPSVFVYTLPNIMIGEICIRNDFKGETAFFVFEHFDTGFIEQYVNNLMNNGILQVCICGWVELLENEYKAVLFLVEKGKGEHQNHFAKENMTKIFQIEKG